jgi:hypothetical protein
MSRQLATFVRGYGAICQRRFRLSHVRNARGGSLHGSLRSANVIPFFDRRWLDVLAVTISADLMLSKKKFERYDSILPVKKISLNQRESKAFFLRSPGLLRQFQEMAPLSMKTVVDMESRVAL